MTELINHYVKNELIPFSLTIGWNTKKNKKELVLPSEWVKVNKDNYEKYISNDIIKSKNTDVINLKNGVALKMGSLTKDNYKIIALDIDNKPDDNDKNIYNGLDKMQELMKLNNINKMDDFKSWVQQTGSNGYHILFKVSLEQYEQIKNITNLVIDGISYSVDVKANENSFLIVEPTKYKTDNNIKRHYRWCKTPYFNKEIQIIPEWIFDLIKQNKISASNPIENQELNIKNIDVISSPEKNDENTELEQLKPLFKLLKKDRINKMDKWFVLACLIKSLYGKKGINLLLELSKNSIFYENDEWIIKRYKEIKYYRYTIRTFFIF